MLCSSQSSTFSQPDYIIWTCKLSSSTFWSLLISKYSPQGPHKHYSEDFFLLREICKWNVFRNCTFIYFWIKEKWHFTSDIASRMILYFEELVVAVLIDTFVLISVKVVVLATHRSGFDIPSSCHARCFLCSISGTVFLLLLPLLLLQGDICVT